MPMTAFLEIPMRRAISAVEWPSVHDLRSSAMVAAFQSADVDAGRIVILLSVRDDVGLCSVGGRGGRAAIDGAGANLTRSACERIEPPSSRGD
ncbi:MAG: hypothetical protein ACREPS_10180 [Rhodanobacteraceae bacterium]